MLSENASIASITGKIEIEKSFIIFINECDKIRSTITKISSIVSITEEIHRNEIILMEKKTDQEIEFENNRRSTFDQ